ncbi:hypothetical protein [Pedobacter sp. MW01-1-1]
MKSPDKKTASKTAKKDLKTEKPLAEKDEVKAAEEKLRKQSNIQPK